MIDIMIWGLGFFAAALGLVLYAANRAPEGYQDETGFHFTSSHSLETSTDHVEAVRTASRATAIL